MMQIVRLSGESRELYQLVAPLVMNPSVISANNNYPFRTSSDFVWFIAVEEECVKGFFPIERRNGKGIINNYYVADNQKQKTMTLLLASAIYEMQDCKNLISVTQMPDRPVFEKHGFSVVKEWKRYVKMQR